MYRETLKLKYKFPNHFRFITNRKATIWGGATLLEALLEGMEHLISYSDDWNWSWNYFINLSESDFPLKLA